jgi:hypothetical protein
MHVQDAYYHQAPQPTRGTVQWPSATKPTLIAYCSWTMPYTDDTFVSNPDLTTGTTPFGFVDGVW